MESLSLVSSRLGWIADWHGIGPSGLTIGPYAGKLLAQLALGEAPSVDLSAYEPVLQTSRM